MLSPEPQGLSYVSTETHCGKGSDMNVSEHGISFVSAFCSCFPNYGQYFMNINDAHQEEELKEREGYGLFI